MGSGGERMNTLERLKELNAGNEWDFNDLGFLVNALPDLMAVVEAAIELTAVARLRGDDVLPKPEDDPKFWTARMQTAWNELDKHIAALEVEA